MCLFMLFSSICYFPETYSRISTLNFFGVRLHAVSDSTNDEDDEVEAQARRRRIQKKYGNNNNNVNGGGGVDDDKEIVKQKGENERTITHRATRSQLQKKSNTYT